MIALPSLLNSGGVSAGIRATAGALHKDIENTKRIMQTIVAGRELLRATQGISAKSAAEIGAP
jgi:hypothetical protein